MNKQITELLKQNSELLKSLKKEKTPDAIISVAFSEQKEKIKELSDNFSKLNKALGILNENLMILEEKINKLEMKSDEDTFATAMKEFRMR